MSIKPKLSLLLFLVFLVLSSGLLCWGETFDEEELESERWEWEWDLADKSDWNQQVSPQRQYRQCRQRCRKEERDPKQQQQCQRACKQQLEQQRIRQCQAQCRRQQTGQQQCLQRCRQQGQQSQQSERDVENIDTQNPYFFPSQRFRVRHKSQHGAFRVLPRFTEQSQLFHGIENYRFATLTVNPNTFVVPHHCDSASILVVVRGRGTIGLVCQEGRTTFNVQCGHVVRVPAGATVYLSNHDNHEQLQIAKLVQPVNTPGQFVEFFATGGADQQSYYSVLPDYILQSSLNTPKQQIDNLFGIQQRSIIRQASPELLRSWRDHASSSRHRIQKSMGPFNIFSQKPTYSSQFGHFHEACPGDEFPQLQPMDVSVSFTNMTQGSIFVPHFNSKATFIVFVRDGLARFEMACPHVAMQQQGGGQQGQGQIMRISSEVSAGDVFIIPVGHPVAVFATEDFRALGFGLRAQNNERNFLAGQNNIMNQLEREALELSFGPQRAELAQRVFKNNPTESYFVSGNEQGQQDRQGGGSNHPLTSILDFGGFF